MDTCKRGHAFDPENTRLYRGRRHCRACARMRHRPDGFDGPAVRRKPGSPPGPVAERFWPKVDVRASDECWPWIGAITTHGYGVLRVAGKNIGAHRLAVILDGRDIPAGYDVMHACDNPPCVNPAHLTVGTRTENMTGMADRGRGWWQNNGAAAPQETGG